VRSLTGRNLWPTSRKLKLYTYLGLQRNVNKALPSEPAGPGMRAALYTH